MGELIDKDEVYKIVGACLDIYNALGFGYLEAVYQEALAIELDKRDIPFEQEKEIGICYKGQVLEKKYYADFFCFDKIIVETKAVANLAPEHVAQTLNYLKATGARVAVLVNFGHPQRLQWKRLVF